MMSGTEGLRGVFNDWKISVPRCNFVDPCHISSLTKNPNRHNRFRLLGNYRFQF